MKENKNLVFGLRSFKKEGAEFTRDGYLLFPDEEKALSFLNLCDNINKNGKTCHYEKFTWVKVNDFVGERVHVQKHFFVPDAEAYTPTEEDFKSTKSKEKVEEDREEIEATE